MRKKGICRLGWRESSRLREGKHETAIVLYVINTLKRLRNRAFCARVLLLLLLVLRVSYISCVYRKRTVKESIRCRYSVCVCNIRERLMTTNSTNIEFLQYQKRNVFCVDEQYLHVYADTTRIFSKFIFKFEFHQLLYWCSRCSI